MLKIKDYTTKIDSLHNEGYSAFDIFKILQLKYPQPIYNYFKKKGWSRLERKDYAPNVIYKSDQTFFNKIDTEEKAYILGFVCADGHICKKTYRLSIALKDSDYKILERIKECIKSEHPVVRHIKKKNPYTKSNNLVLEQCTLSINGKKLIEPLCKMGIAGKKTYTLDSSIINIVPENLIRHFLRGYFDGDGSVTWGKEYSSGKKYLIQIAGNKEFLENTYQKYFPSACRIYKYKTAKQCYTWKISDKKQVLKFLNYIYEDANIYLERKHKIYLYAMWSFKTELIAGNSFFFDLIKGQSAANLLVKSWEQVQRLTDETILNPYEEGSIEYNSDTNARQSDSSNISD